MFEWLTDKVAAWKAIVSFDICIVVGVCVGVDGARVHIFEALACVASIDVVTVSTR